MSIRIVSFLGKGKDGYEKCLWKLGDRVLPETATWCHDVPTLLDAFDNKQGAVSLIVLGTKEVKEQWFLAQGKPLGPYQEELRKHLGRSRFEALVWGFEEIKQNDTNQIFEVVTKLLKPEPLLLRQPGDDTTVLEKEVPDEIIIDITHGFRVQPILATLGILYQIAQYTKPIISHRDCKDTTKSKGPSRVSPTPNIRMIYAAFEAGAKQGNQRVAPIWDLTKFIDGLRFIWAIHSLMRFGRADLLEETLGVIQAQLVKEQTRTQSCQFPKFKQFGRAAKEFADGLATARVPFVITRLTDKLANAIDESKQDLKQHVPYVAGQLDELLGWVKKLSAQEVVSKQGLNACVHLGEIYLQLERFSELSALIREWVVTACTVATSKTKVLQPGCKDKDFDRQRKDAELWLNIAGQNTPLGKLFGDIRQIRNDVQHAGFNSDPTNSSTIRNNLEKILSQLAKIIQMPEQDQIDGYQQRKPVLVNCSNHPLQTWPPEQKRALTEFGIKVEQVIDIPFPEVPPDMDEEQVKEKANDVIKKIEEYNPQAVFIAGELALTWHVITKLKKAGVKCLVPTSKRCVEETVDQTGTVHRRSEFRFVRWREI